MRTFITIIHILTCIFLMLVVLLQSGRDGGMGAMGGGGSQTVFGGRGAGNFLTRLTGICAAIFMSTSMILSLIAARHGGSLESKAELFNTPPEQLEQIDPTSLEAPKEIPNPTTASLPTSEATSTSAPTSEPASEATTQAATLPGAPVNVELPAGPTLSVAPGSLEDQLVAFIKDPTTNVSKEKWFDFDRLRFATGKTELTPESTDQLNNVISILKAYPKVKIKVGAYTDNTGVAADNKKLSKERADYVKNELVKLGVTADRISAEGYGDQHPIAPNDTDENRAKNRRISLSVREK
jgi:protein translocase SecG subunit